MPTLPDLYSKLSLLAILFLAMPAGTALRAAENAGSGVV